mmetsp:Transcript_12163/g.37518  ORF Transcript_12163/g.37518 Transcript_12163/m.37518 type:complete len:232 (-) Transcript_12163:1509-2204(-)
MTLAQASAKSHTNLSSPSSAAYTSAMARSSLWEPKMRSAREAVCLTSPAMTPSNVSSPAARHSTSVSVSRSKKTGDRRPSDEKMPRPSADDTPSERRPATSTDISGAVSPSSCARSSSISSGRGEPPAGAWCVAKLRKPSASGSSTAKPSASVCSAEASPRPGTNSTSMPPPAAASTAAVPPSTMVSATLAPCLAASGSSTASTLASCSGLLAAQSFIGARRTRAPLAPPR